ncbi:MULTISPECIES: GNAT family N-acetyltransferase [Desulfitobacterium]|uniref:Acetyltransferase, ribosomal protein N-acetylase n=1 Tax=Desulfitobacterium dehalogenans (strain ATCC 51507 / DSM 9161 / JW/IU-DC1) TaxID=756499 RepID=I4A6M5_DESDJ|nr:MULTISPECIES: GNAT family N-acetyltransferase [Desulfitobacterium]AFL99609.1 acetyltransferase, ribosomal protein N-acetylase [Desulfitobacterium dehalogenans ATCC 51507]
MRHIGTKKLETERLILRKFELNDAEAMFRNWASDAEVTKYLIWPPHDNVAVSLEVLKDWISQYKDHKFYQWAIVCKENGPEPIGSISIVKMDERIGMVHVGYCLGKRWWGKGVASEALAELIRFFFEEVEVNRIESRHDPRNPNSGRVMKKCGLVYEGTVKQGDWCNQGICDCSMYGLVAEDYYSSKK